MSKNKNQAKKSVSLQSLPLIHPNAAGIDVGAKEHVVAVPADRDPKPVRSFKAFTPDLHELAQWLKQCGVETVALESTGIYWITLYEILEERGFQVRVVNARHVKNVPGRTKTDVLDCQWIQKLHSFGLLSGSFRPDQQIRTLRSLMRLRDNRWPDGAASTQPVDDLGINRSLDRSLETLFKHGRELTLDERAILGRCSLIPRFLVMPRQ